MRCLLPFGLLVVVASAQAAPNFKRVVLPNGLTVLAVENRGSAVAGLHLGVRYDPAGIGPARAGVAALSQQVLQGQLRELLKQEPWEQLGQQLRGTRAGLVANTECDYCEIRGHVTDDMLPQAVQLAGRMLLGQQPVKPEDLQAARELLLAHERDDTNTVVEQTYYSLLKACFGRRAPLAQPVQGTAETLKALTATDVAAFRATYMTPGNAVLTLIAPRATSDLVDVAALATSAYPAGRTRVPTPTASFSAAPRIYVAQAPGWRGVSVMVGVPAPGYGTPDFLKAQLMHTLLEGKGGRLERDPALRAGLGLNRIASRGDEPASVTALAPMAQPRPLLILHMVMPPRQMEQARMALLRQFVSLQSEPPTAAEMERAKSRLINSYARLRLDYAGLAKAISCYELYGGDVNLAWQAESRIEAITGQDLMALAQEWFTTHAIGVLMPGDE